MKKFIVLLLSVTLVFSSVPPLTAIAAIDGTNDVRITLDSQTAFVNGQEVTLDVPAKLIKGRVLVPVRFIAENLGIPVEWDKANHQILIGADKSVILAVGSNRAVVNGKEVLLDASVIIEKNTALAPVRLILEHFGADVQWNGDVKEVSVSYSETDQLANTLYRQSVAGEKEVLDAVDAQYGWQIARDLTKFGSNIRGWGYRLSGTEKGKEASEYIFKQFNKIGLKPAYKTFPVFGQEFTDASLTLTNQDNMNIPVLPLSGTVPTEKEGLTGELVYVNNATKQDLEGVDLTGKIAVVAADLDYMPWYNEVGYQCQLHGANAVIYYCANYYALDPSGEAFYQGAISGSDVPVIPVLTTPINYGKKLEALMSKGTVTAKLICDVQNYPKATGYNVVASIEGSKYPDEYVVMSAHSDAHFYGFQDDSLGIGMLLALAKAMVDTDYQPERTILFVATDAEETGSQDTYYTWLIGSWNYITDMVGELGGKVVGNINIELQAAKEADYLKVRSSDTLYSFLQDMSKGITQTAYGTPGIEVWNDMANWDDSYCFSYYGIPGATTNYLYKEVNAYYYHSQFETESRADFDKYKDDMTLYCAMVMRLDKLPVEPYDLSVTPANYLEALDAASLNSLIPNNTLSQEAEAFLQNSKKLWDKQVLISSQYQQAVAAGKDVKQADALIVKYNQALRDTAKTVIMGTQYLDQGTNTYLTPYYLNTVNAFDSGIASLSSGDGQAMLDTFSNAMLYAYYSEFMDKKTFEECYKEPINVDTWTANLYWATDRLLKYYDFYDTLNSIRTKAASGDKDFSAEIAALKTMRADAFSRLNQAVAADSMMWKKADSQFPFESADKILEALK